MQIFVYSRDAMNMVTPHEVPHVVISITSSTDDVARIRDNPLCKGILRLAFPDIEVASDRHPESELFSRENAAQIWSFVREHLPTIERILVHCDAGVSRSAAVGSRLRSR